jgi:transcriptional regulator with XRE-family HTH domain
MIHVHSVANKQHYGIIIDMSTAAEIVSSIRSSRLLSMNALADLAGIPTSTVSRIEAGKIDPTYSMLLRIAQAAGFSLSIQVQEAGSDQPFASYLAKFDSAASSIREAPTKELHMIASLALVARRRGATRFELTGNLKDIVRELVRQGQDPIVSALEAYNERIEPLQSFVPIIYVNDPAVLVGFEPASAYSPCVMFAIPTTDNVRANAAKVKDIMMVSREWGLLDALASPGRQPDAALEILATDGKAVA